ncbi:MAG: DUF3786 domain-containing protein [Firmicutes bacterium]|nr:DUF3786 domain-containing protein [Bacillota bacterium]
MALDAYAVALESFLRLDPAHMAAAGGASWDPGGRVLRLRYFGRDLEVAAETGEISAGPGPWRLTGNDRTLVLQYLTGASGLPPRGRWLSFLELPDGGHHYGPFREEALEPLARGFDGRAEEFVKAGRLLGGAEARMADAALVIPAFPKLPMAVLLWHGDEEFPARAAILYDSVAPTHLSTASLYVLGCELARKMLR